MVADAGSLPIFSGPDPQDTSRRRFLIGLISFTGLGTAWAALRDVLGGETTPSTSTPPLAAATTTTSTTTTTVPRTTTTEAATATTEATTTTTEVETSTTTEPRPTLLVIEKAAWGGLPEESGFEPHTPDRITVHHTAALLEVNSNAPSLIRRHQRYHQSLGWPDLAYHVMIDRNGNLYEGRPLEFRGDTATNYDPTGHFLPCLEGDYREEMPTEVQIEALAMVCAWAADRWGLDPSTIAGHLDYAATTCPGQSVYALLADGSLATRVQEILEDGVPRLEYLRGADATAAVAAIEAGGA